jgi:hypothetical protein
VRLFGRRKRAPRGLPSYWNGSVVERIERDGGVDHETARAWFNEMLVFLDMAADSKHLISPPKPVDVAWHAFILHTRDYESYCRERYGHVIHHQPTGAPDPDAYRRAYERRATYGGVDNAIWIVPPLLADGGGGGGHDGGGGESVGPAIQDAGSGAGGDLFGGGDGGGSSCGGGGCSGGGSG